MIPKEITEVDRRYDFTLVFDVMDGNPNGDPDSGNLPRVDPETMQGIVTDVALKRKVRDYVQTVHGNKDKYDIYVKHRGILTREQRKAFEALDIENPEEDSATKIKDAREWMCQHYYDTRMFGAVMSTTKYNAGQVRGPLQLTFARSIDPITPLDLTITRVALTNPHDADKDVPDDEVEARHGQMGRKAYIPYGMYVAHGFYSPSFAQQTGVKAVDLQIFWESLMNMWDFDRSASRGRMATRGLYVFKHDSIYGNAPSHLLFDKINIKKDENIESARSAEHYNVEINQDLPSGVNLYKLLSF